MAAGQAERRVFFLFFSAPSSLIATRLSPTPETDRDSRDARGSV